MTRDIVVATIITVLFTTSGWYVYTHHTPTNPGATVSNADDSAVRAIVTDFGKKLQLVPLFAPATDRKNAMEAIYSEYVAPELLMQWYPEGVQALGRSTSNPRPERIDIVDVRFEGGRAVVEGNVIEVTNQADAAPAAVYPVTLTLENREGTWFIVAATKGAYSQLPQQQTITGYWECLPHKIKTGPQTMECAFGIALDQGDGHIAIDTSLMSTYPVDFPAGPKGRVTGLVTPASQLSGTQKYDIDAIIRATSIEKVQ